LTVLGSPKCFKRHFLTVPFVAFLACSKDEECEDGSTSKYFSAKVPDRNIAGSGEFLLTVYNPASSQGKKLQNMLIYPSN
jgi:hypothetical protein